MAKARGVDEVRRDIAHEREGLADSIESLRREVGGALDVTTQVGSRVRVLVPAAFATAFILSGGVGATMRYFARRGRER